MASTSKAKLWIAGGCSVGEFLQPKELYHQCSDWFSEVVFSCCWIVVISTGERAVDQDGPGWS